MVESNAVLSSARRYYKATVTGRDCSKPFAWNSNGRFMGAAALRWRMRLQVCRGTWLMRRDYWPCVVGIVGLKTVYSTSGM